MYLNFEKEMDPRNLRHIRFSDQATHNKYLKFKMQKVRENWKFLKYPLQFLCIIVLSVEYFYNHLETEEQTASFLGAWVLIFEVEIFSRLVKKYDFITRFGGICMFCTFGVYMAEITVQNNYYKLYEGFLVLGSVEFLMSITLTVDTWICPFAVFFSHTYAFLRIYLQYDKVSDVLCPGLYCPLFHFTMSCHLFSLHSKKEFLLTEMQKEMIQRFISILKTFPERIVISQKNELGEVDYAFTNDKVTEDNLFNDNEESFGEYILRRGDEVNLFDQEAQQIEIDRSIPLDLFLEEERVTAMENDKLISESKITSIAPKHFNESRDYEHATRNDSAGEEGKEGVLSKRHYTVKTKQIEWKQFNNIDAELNRRSGDNSSKIISFLHIFIDNTEKEKLKYEKTLREYQRMMLSSVAHEFRNPLNAIQGNLQLIELNNDPKIEKYVKISRSSCTLLNSYVEDILDLGRIEGSAFQLNCEEFNIKDVFDEVYDIFEIELKRK